jgi:hypothetical protein
MRHGPIAFPWRGGQYLWPSATPLAISAAQDGVDHLSLTKAIRSSFLGVHDYPHGTHLEAWSGWFLEPGDEHARVRWPGLVIRHGVLDAAVYPPAGVLIAPLVRKVQLGLE